MGITSFYFLCFFAAVLLIYYLTPGKAQWCVLLGASIFFYLTQGEIWLIVYPLAASAVCHYGMRCMAAAEDAGRKKKLFLVVIGLNLACLILLKYINFGINTVNGIAGWFGAGEVLKGFAWLVPLGISYYTLTLLGYVTDVYFGIAQPVGSVWKTALYGMYFPCMISGPILRFRENGEQFFEPHRFDFNETAAGMQRMLWGFFKKLVISERMAVIVSAVYGDYTSYPGLYIWIATAAFAFQLYTDFGGCMDIVLGLSQCFGLKLPENFRTPFFSKTISEYWRRWHITLGVWMKDYVFYPLLRSRFFMELGKKNKIRFGKKRGKQLTTFAGMFVLWFTVGVWHGGDWKYVIGSGLLHWCYIVGGELLEPWFQKGLQKCGIDARAGWLDKLRMLRTFFLVNIGFVFFRAASTGDAWRMLWLSVRRFSLQPLKDGGLLALGLDGIELTIAVVSLLLLLAVSLFQEKKGSVRAWIAARPVAVRFLIWYALLFYVILLGYYGPGYSAAEFIYQGF